MKADDPSTRERLISASSRLFADHGYRGASVRDICNLAGTNPGAVSYHFGGKRQLYRTVLRQAAEGLAEAVAPIPEGLAGAGRFTDRTLALISRLELQLEEDPIPARLILRDLADGGGIAVEALAPRLRAAFDALSTELGHGDVARGTVEDRLLFLELAAPLFLLIAAWPVIEAAIGLENVERQTLLLALARNSLERNWP